MLRDSPHGQERGRQGYYHPDNFRKDCKTYVQFPPGYSDLRCQPALQDVQKNADLLGCHTAQGQAGEEPDQERNQTLLIDHAIETVKDAGFVKPGDRVVITAGDPIFNVQGEAESCGETNMMYVVTVEE